MVILRGQPGAGKSTYAKKLKDFFIKRGLLAENIVICEADDFFMKNGVYCFDSTKLGIAHKICQNKAEKAISEGKYVIVANTNIKIRDLNEYIKIANKYNVNFEVHRLMTHYQNVHNVPEEKVKQMEENLVPYDGEICIW